MWCLICGYYLLSFQCMCYVLIATGVKHLVRVISNIGVRRFLKEREIEYSVKWHLKRKQEWEDYTGRRMVKRENEEIWGNKLTLKGLWKPLCKSTTIEVHTKWKEFKWSYCVIGKTMPQLDISSHQVSGLGYIMLNHLTKKCHRSLQIS